MITEKQQALIDKVMDCFDFRKVVSYMKRKKWEWVDTDGRRYIPEETELRTNVCTSQSAPNPNPETVRNLRKSDEDSESEALLNQIPDTAKMVDNIIKDGFRDHNRLHIASIAMAGILAAPLDNVGFITNKCVDDVAEYALRCADALLELTANTTKGGSK